MGDLWRRFCRNRPALVGLFILFVFLILSLLAPYITSHNPIRQSLSTVMLPPSLEHPFGTDHLGRDIATRILYGTRISLLIGLFSVSLGLLLGVPLGLLSGYYGGWVDMLIQRFADILFSFPSILLALALVAVLGIGLQNIIIAVGISVLPIFIRLVRGTVLTIRSQTYIEAAKALALPDRVILFRHILKNALAPIIVQSTLSMGITILLAAGLGFLGLGVQPPTPEWGSMLGEGRQYILSHPYMSTFPGLAIFLSVLAFNLVGDGLRDALDPHLKNTSLTR